jgi:hypothetical protein
MNKGFKEVIVCERRDLKYLAVLRVAADVRANGTVDDWTSRRSFASRPMNGAKTVSAPYACGGCCAGAFRTSQAALEHVGIKVSA